MRIAVQSASASVARSLVAMIQAAGHHLATATDHADLVLVDAQHPLQHTAPSDIPRLTLIANPTANEHEITCPFRPQQLIQRLMMRGHTSAIPLNDDWSLDLLARCLKHPQITPLTLTEKECILLKNLAYAASSGLTRDALLESVWGMAGDVDTHTLETHIYRLRAKLAELSPTPCDIITENGAYLLALREK